MNTPSDTPLHMPPNTPPPSCANTSASVPTDAPLPAPDGPLPPLFDSHAHYNDSRFDADRDALLGALLAGPVAHILNCGVTYQDSLACLALARRWPGMLVAAGIHPDNGCESTPADLERLRALYADPLVVAVGEIGLDYHWDTPRDQQRFYFEAQLQMANDLGLPVVVHDREAHTDTLDLLQRYRPKGVVHCFSGSAEMARAVVELGMYVGFTGVVTFAGARRPLAAAAAVPPERLLIETDCPYMAPVPFRGRRCDSGMLPHTAAALAAVHGMTTAGLIARTAQNAEALFLGR